MKKVNLDRLKVGAKSTQIKTFGFTGEFGKPVNWGRRQKSACSEESVLCIGGGTERTRMQRSVSSVSLKQLKLHIETPM